jgi:Domain of unknown function (DUF6647)
MLKQAALSAALLTSAIIGPSSAQSAEQATALAAIDPSPVFGDVESPPDAARPSEALLTEIVTWLAENYGLAAIHDHPRIEFARQPKLVAVRYNTLLPEGWREGRTQDPAVPAVQQREVVALYNDMTKTIFLPDAWTGKTPAEVSVLVHEMVHHLQNLAGLKYDCPAAREKPAYLAQDKWLQHYGLDLETEFQIDKFTLVVNSACMG